MDTAPGVALESIEASPKPFADPFDPSTSPPIADAPLAPSYDRLHDLPHWSRADQPVKLERDPRLPRSDPPDRDWSAVDSVNRHSDTTIPASLSVSSVGMLTR